MSVRSHSTAGVILIVAILLAVSVTTNLTFFFRSPEYTYPDSATYLVPARHLANGNGFTDKDGLPETLRTPGYPLLLVPFLKLGAEERDIVLAQHLLNIVVTLLLFALVWRVTDDRAIALVASLLFAVDPTTLRYSNRVLTETVFTAVLLAIFAALAFALEDAHFLRIRAAAIGAGCGVLALIRPAGVFFFVPAALFILLAWPPRRWQCAAILAVASLVIPACWTARNYAQSGIATFSSVGATNLLLYRAAGVLAIDEPGDFIRNQTRQQNRLLQLANARLASEWHTTWPDGLPHAVRARTYGAIAREILARRPVAYLRLAARGCRHLLLDDDAVAVEMATDFDDRIETAVRVYTWLLFAAAAAGLFILFRRNWRLALLGVLTLAYFLTITAGGEAESRFRTPIVPQYALFAATGVVSLFRRKRMAS